MSPSTTAAPRPKSPKQMHYLISFNSLPYGSGTNKCGIQDGTSHDQFGIQTKNGFVNSSEKGTVGNLKENGNSSYSNNSSEVCLSRSI